MTTFILCVIIFLLCVCTAQFIIILRMRSKKETAAREPENNEETVLKSEERAEQEKHLQNARQSLECAMELLPNAVDAMQGLIDKIEQYGSVKTDTVQQPDESEDTKNTGRDNEIVQAELCECQNSAVPPPNLPFENVKVLVCEDYEQNREVMNDMLEEFGIEPQFAANGIECLDILNSGKTFDMIFMDLQMPLMDGYETARSIRSNCKYNSVPIISMTANAMRDRINKCFETGMNDHIAKPVEYDRLEYVLYKWLPEDKKIPA